MDASIPNLLKCHFGVEQVRLSGDFPIDGWKLRGEIDLECAECDDNQNLIALYSPQVSTKGLVYLRWALACLHEGLVSEPKNHGLTSRQIRTAKDSLDGDAEMLRLYSEYRNIRWLCHFTTLENLEGIAKAGAILSQADLMSWELPFRANDVSRFDGNPHLISSTIEYPNIHLLTTWMNSSVESEWCVILFDPQSLFRFGTKFSAQNAAKFNGRNLAEGFDGMSKMYGGQRVPAHLESVPTSLQAEALIPSPVFQRDFLGIVVRDSSAEAKVRKLLSSAGGKLPVISDYRFFEMDLLLDSVRSGNPLVPGDTRIGRWF